MSVPMQRDLKKADARRFDALRDLEYSLLSYQAELPSTRPYDQRFPDSSRLNQIFGACAQTLRDIETELDPDLDVFQIGNRCWGVLVNACSTVQTVLYQVRELPGSSDFQNYIREILAPTPEHVANSPTRTRAIAESPRPEPGRASASSGESTREPEGADLPEHHQSNVPDPFQEEASPRALATEDPIRTAGPKRDGEGQLPNQLAYLKAPVFRYQYPQDFPDGEQIAIENARLEANRELESKCVCSHEERGAARSEWFWHLVSAAARAIGRAGASQQWGVNRRREMLLDFGSKTAGTAGIAGRDGRLFDKVRESEEWQALDDYLLRPFGNEHQVSPSAPQSGSASLPYGRRDQDGLNSGAAILSLRKRDGRVFEGLNAHFSAKAILVMDVAGPIEEGDMLIRTLSSGLRVGFIVDSPGYREALGSITAHFEVKGHRAAPIDSLERSGFWRRLRADFEQLCGRQRDALGIDREHPRWLRGYCSRLEEDSGKLAYCDVEGGLDAEFRSKFEDVATQAAIALGCSPDGDPLNFWLCCLCLDLLQNSTEAASKELLQSVPGGGFIVDLLGSSAAYCSRLAAKADLRASENLSQSPPQSIIGDSPEAVTGSSGDQEMIPAGNGSDAESRQAADGPVPALTERAKTRSAWLDQRLIRHSSYDSDTDIAAGGGLTYNTVRRYRSGLKSRRDFYVRRGLAKAFKCDIREVPE
jgi:hypothetical protein